MHDDVGCPLPAQDIGERAERCLHDLGGGRHADGGAAASLGKDMPAGGGERLCSGQAEAAVGTEDEDGAGRR